MSGAGRRLIWSGRADEGFAPISEVLWSPDGSEILFLSNELYLVRPDGGGLRRLGIPRHVPNVRLAPFVAGANEVFLLSRWGIWGLLRP